MYNTTGIFVFFIRMIIINTVFDMKYFMIKRLYMYKNTALIIPSWHFDYNYDLREEKIL